MKASGLIVSAFVGLSLSQVVAAQCSASTQAGADSTTGVVRTASYEQASSKPDIVDTAVKAGMFKTLAAALQAADLVTALKGEGPFTVFAPTDEAFAKLPKGTVEELLKPENKDRLVAVLTYHVVPARAMAKDVTGLKFADTLNGQRVDIRVKDAKVMIDNATVTQADIECGNGVIHVIDQVILPKADNVLTTAAKAGSFKTLAAAVQAAGLESALNGKGPFTIFAPTDEAFAALPKGTLESLLKPENKAQLAKILTYHVVAGRVYSDQVVKLTAAPTLANQDAKVTVKDGTVMIDAAKVTSVDIECANGVIHVIDAVIIPK